MISLFNPTDSQHLIYRIEQLTPESKALWGKMNVSQMLYHCACPLQVAVGELRIKREFFGLIFGRMAKKRLSNDDPFKKNLPTVKKFIPEPTLNFKEEQKKLIFLIKRFDEEGPNIVTREPHPFFGDLTVEEWDILQSKHLDHHLRQFGV